MEEKDYEVAEVIQDKGTIVPDFDLDRLAKDIDGVFQAKLENNIKDLRKDSTKLLNEVDDKLTEQFTDFKQRVDAIFPDIKERLVEEIQRGRTIIVLPNAQEVNVQHMDHPVTEGAIKSLQLQRKLMLVGPAGTGKTTMVEKIAKSLDIAFYKYSCSRDSSVHDLLGYKQPTSETYLETTFLNAYENGGIFLVDEYDAMSGDMALFFNGVADNSKFISIPHRDSKPQAVKHKDFYLVMCGNTWGKGSTDYSGRDFQDMALMDRFRFCRHHVGYHILLEKEFMKHNYESISRLRSALENVGSYLSTRNVEDISILIECDVPFTSILDMVLQDLAEDDKRRIKDSLSRERVVKTPPTSREVQTPQRPNFDPSTSVRDGQGRIFKLVDLMKAFPADQPHKMEQLKQRDKVLHGRYLGMLMQQGLATSGMVDIETYTRATNNSSTWLNDGSFIN
jgi:MoxR-like ATPase